MGILRLNEHVASTLFQTSSARWPATIAARIEGRASRLNLDHHAFEFQPWWISKNLSDSATHAKRKSGANLCFLIPQIVFGLTVLLAAVASLHANPCTEFGVDANCQEARGITTSASDN